ncbi:MAG: ABC transporter substrate-binding protein, partial [Hyphomicrobiales bacterium]|nr:ABC transporter substrate-binding protein [Hyphomicrobiales bacterium]
GAYSKGAPIRIVAAEATGAADFWYARADSSIRSMKDAAGKTIAYSTTGASTNIFVLALIKAAGITAQPVATGGPTPTLTQVMSGQIDIGWSAPPFGLPQIAENKIRIVARASDVLAGREQTIRSYVTTARVLQAKRAALTRFLAAYRETVDWMYAGEEPIKVYADFAGIPLDLARRVRDEFFPKSLIDPDQVKGMDELVKEAVNLKFIPAPLTAQQIAELIQIPPRKK